MYQRGKIFLVWIGLSAYMIFGGGYALIIGIKIDSTVIGGPLAMLFYGALFAFPFAALLGIPVLVYEIVQAFRYRGKLPTSPDDRFLGSVSMAAYLNPFVWAIGQKMYRYAILSLIPYFGIYPWFRMTFHGRKNVWETHQYKTMAEMRKRELVLLIVSIIIDIPLFFFSVMVVQEAMSQAAWS